MSKKDEFKNFVSQNPTLIDLVASKTHTWQELYEVYANIEGLNELTKVLKNVNLDNVQKYINTAQKALAVIESLTISPEKNITGPLSKVPINKIFED